jgi:hypothetical protein
LVGSVINILAESPFHPDFDACSLQYTLSCGGPEPSVTKKSPELLCGAIAGLMLWFESHVMNGRPL